MSLALTSYITESEANEYFATVLNTEAWDDAETPTRLKALSQATGILDMLPYVNKPVAEDQAHAFPRGAQTAVPIAIKRATAQLALELLDGFSYLDFDDNSIIASGYSAVRETHDKDKIHMHKWLGLPRSVYIILMPFLDLGTKNITIHRVS